MNLGESIRSGTQWLLTGRVFEQGLSFVFGVILARLLVPEDFGLVATVGIFTGLAGQFLTGGMNAALIQAKEINERDYQVVFTLQLISCALVYAFFFAIAPWFAIWFDNKLYTDLLRVSAISFILRPFDYVPRSKLRREMRFKAIVSIQFVTLPCGGLVSVLLAFNGMGFWSLVWGGLAGAMISIMLCQWVACWRPRIYFRTEVAKRLGSYGVKVAITDILEYVRVQSSKLLVSRFLGAAELGLYNRALSLSEIAPGIICTSAYQTVFRGLSKVQDNKDTSKYIYFRTITLTAVYTLPFSIGLFWIAEPFIRVVYGEKWLPSALPLQILSQSAVFYCITTASRAVIAAQNQLFRQMQVQLECLAVIVISAWIGLKWGLVGIAWAVLLGSVYYSLRLLKVASRSIEGNFRNLMQALKPSLLLNAILLSILFLADRLLAYWQVGHPVLYLLGMVSAGSLSYALAFLYLPIASLETETRRWRKFLRLEIGKQPI